MGDKEYLYDLALVLDSAESTQQFGEPPFIRIEVMTAKDIASRLRQIANRMTMVH